MCKDSHFFAHKEETLVLFSISYNSTVILAFICLPVR